MPITCWAVDCTHNNKRDSCKFFSFPRDQKTLSRWIKLLRRDATPGSGARVCSCHFRGSVKANGPELFDRNKDTLFSIHHLSPERRKKTHHGMIDTGGSTSSTIIETGPPISDEPRIDPQPMDCVEGTSSDITLPSTSKTTPQENKSLAVLEAENYFLQREIEKRDKIIKNLRVHFTYAHICEQDHLILEYTGLPTRNIFESLLFLIEGAEINYYLNWKVQKLSIADQLLVTLMKLRQNFPHTDLAFRFNISTATVTNIVVTYIHLMYEILVQKMMNVIPTRAKNKSCLPNCASTFTNCRIIIDCTEVFSAIPRQSMKNQRVTYSSYKHRNTLKGLVGVAPNGVITFISDLYPGSTSDKAIVASCGVLKQMEAGDLILADKGFLIRDILPAGVTLNIPPFLTTPQFTKEQIRRTECIARARIHVERAIKRMKTYKILSFIPTMLFSYSSIIFKCIAGLTNLQYPLIKEVGELYTDLDVNLEHE